MAELRRSPKVAKSRECMNHIFVDFENVPTVDLALIGDHVAEVTLLIGEKQRRLELTLVRQIHEHAAKVNLIEVGASGRNALDLVLAWHLGKTAERHPDDHFFVVSKDKDFDPLITHLRARKLNVERIDAFSMLPFLPTRATGRRASTPRAIRPLEEAPIARKAERASVSLPSPESANDTRLAKVIRRLQHKTKARPVRRKTLLSHINGFYSNLLSEPELEAVVETLKQRGVIEIDPHGRVGYPETGAVGKP